MTDRVPAHLLGQMALILGPVVGFLSAWLLFELTEHRRRKLAQKAIRNTAIAELRQAELILSSMVVTFSRGAQDVAKGVQEFRWMLARGVRRARFTGLEPTPVEVEELERFKDRSDEQIGQILTGLPAEQTTHALEVRLPVLDAILGTPTAGFRGDEIQALSSVRWQLHMLSEEARTMADMLRFTFSVEDAVNHGLVVANLRAARSGYRKRNGVALVAVRSALVALGAKEEP